MHVPVRNEIRQREREERCDQRKHSFMEWNGKRNVNIRRMGMLELFCLVAAISVPNEVDRRH